MTGPGRRAQPDRTMFPIMHFTPQARYVVFQATGRRFISYLQGTLYVYRAVRMSEDYEQIPREIEITDAMIWAGIQVLCDEGIASYTLSAESPEIMENLLRAVLAKRPTLRLASPGEASRRRSRAGYPSRDPEALR